MEKIKIRLFVILFFFAAGFLCFSQSASAENMTHTVKKGDTLWDLCEYYYGDSSLWPKLWQMNSFITNPHLLSPGDVITLFERPLPETTEKQAEPVIPAAEEPGPVMGINIANSINTDRIGFYSSKKIDHWGTLFATADKNMFLMKDNTVYVIFEEGKSVSIGDEFETGRISPVVHPLTKKKSGYLFDISGRLKILKKAGLDYDNGDVSEKRNAYQAKIIDAYVPIQINEVVMPYRKFSPCILPVSNNTDILANIVSGAGDQDLIHKDSIAYMDKGSDNGVKIGNVFEIRMGNIVKDPKPDKALTFYEEQVILPDRVFGRVLVIDTYPDSATVIVLSASEPVEAGAYLKNIPWTETPEFISNHANCPVE